LSLQDPEPRVYKTPAALRDGLEARLAVTARRSGADVGRLRRRVVFERLLVRLSADAEGHWVLKGGSALELRLPELARATRDLDLAIVEASDGRQVHSLLMDALTEDVQQDFFSFAVAPPRPLNADRGGRPGWRFPVEARLAARTFATVRLEVVARADEIAGGTEPLTFASSLAFARYPASVSVEAVDLAQHAAEKFHALTRIYGERPNTRVKDLVDLVLLIENDLVDRARLGERLRTVFDVRGTHPMPDDLPAAPAAWDRDYTALVADLEVEARTVDTVLDCVRPVWRSAVIADSTTTGKPADRLQR
jgi:predicted nucleotidyltransferase component of viral defense system